MQAAFREHHGLQCGFCTPGMIMTAVDMIRRYGGELDEATVRHELDGNICRCTGYHNIVKAILAAAAEMKGGRRRRRKQRPSRRRRSVTSTEENQGRKTMGVEGIGARVVRKEDKRFITGRGRYTDDMSVPGMCYAAFVRSPHAHAKIGKIDTAAAAKMPGVIKVLTGAELAADGIGNLICGWAITSKDGSPMKMGAYPALADDTVRYVGQPVGDRRGAARAARRATPPTRSPSTGRSFPPSSTPRRRLSPARRSFIRRRRTT